MKFPACVGIVVVEAHRKSSGRYVEDGGRSEYAEDKEHFDSRENAGDGGRGEKKRLRLLRRDFGGISVCCSISS